MCDWIRKLTFVAIKIDICFDNIQLKFVLHCTYIITKIAIKMVCKSKSLLSYLVKL